LINVILALSTNSVHKKLLALNEVPFRDLNEWQAIFLEAFHATTLETIEVRMVSGASRFVRLM